MKLESADWLQSSETQAVFAMLHDAGHQAYAVGGCVRNALLDTPVSDVDIATDAHPETVSNLAQKAGLKAIPTGAEHGTITVVAGGTGYEVTTFRADIQTDGRHAVVQFSTDIHDDARRRDFTMNALYVDADGSVIDPLGGLSDLTARRVRFIEDAAQRIEEDYLRILRFFRFSAWYGNPDLGFDPEALGAIAQHLDGLDGLSRERVGGEVTKLLGAPDPAPAVGAMQKVGVLTRCLPGADPRALAPLVHLEMDHGFAPNYLRRLAALGDFDVTGLRLSRADQRRLALYQSLIPNIDGPRALGYRHGVDVARDVLILRAALLETPLYGFHLQQSLDASQAKFPVTAHDLMPGLQGAQLGQRLTELEDRWIASGFALTRKELLA